MTDAALGDLTPAQAGLAAILKEGIEPVRMFQAYGWHDPDDLIPEVLQALSELRDGTFQPEAGLTEGLMDLVSRTRDAAQSYADYAWQDHNRVRVRMTLALEAARAEVSVPEQDSPRP